MICPGCIAGAVLGSFIGAILLASLVYAVAILRFNPLEKFMIIIKGENSFSRLRSMPEEYKETELLDLNVNTGRTQVAASESSSQIKATMYVTIKNPLLAPLESGATDDQTKESDIETGSLSSRQRGRPNTVITTAGTASSAPSPRPPLYPSTVEAEEQESTTVVEISTIVKSGYLLKLSSGGRAWQRRWFFIAGGHLYYVHRPIELHYTGSHRVQATLVAPLLLATVREAAPPATGSTTTSVESGSSTGVTASAITTSDTASASTVFQVVAPGARKGVRGGGTYELKAESAGERAEWVAVLRREILAALAASTIAHSSSSSGSGGRRQIVYAQALSPAQLAEVQTTNPTCADCCVASPSWASTTFCVLLCADCSGAHRGLGATVSRVRSLQLDKWSEGGYALLLVIGNRRANRVLEGREKKNLKAKKLAFSQLVSSSSGGNGSGGSSSNSSAAIHAIRLQFITIKYVSKLYMDRTAISNEEEASTLLLRAASSGSLLDLYTALLHGADVNSTTTVAEGLSTALHLSARGGHTLCVQLLCQWGARTTEVDVTGATALDLAGEKKYTDVIEILQNWPHTG